MFDFILAVLYGGTIGAFKKYKWFRVFCILAIPLFIVVETLSSLYNPRPQYGWQYDLLFFYAVIVVVVGIIEYIKGIPYRRKIREWQEFMSQLKLSPNDKPPVFMYERNVSEFAHEIAFKTTTPLNIWQAKRSALEMRLNKKILAIVQDEKDNQIIKLITQNKELPNKIDWSEYYHSPTINQLTLGVGHFNISIMDLAKHPHAFIAGETGSGKSNLLKCLIHQAIVKDYEVVLIDFKRGVSFSAFSELLDIYYDYPSVIKVLQDMVNETNRRLDLFREKRVDNLSAYNISSGKSLKRKIIFIDELAELLRTRDKTLYNSLYDSLETLTRLSRAVGIHLIMGIQRPDSTIVSGQIKNNVSFRVCGRFVDKEPSRIMLGGDEASHLPNVKGRFIVKDDDMHEMQAFYYHDVYVDSLEHRQEYEHGDKHHADSAMEVEDKPIVDEIITTVDIPDEPPVVEVLETEKPPEKPPKAKAEIISGEIEFDFSDMKK